MRAELDSRATERGSGPVAALRDTGFSSFVCKVPLFQIQQLKKAQWTQPGAERETQGSCVFGSIRIDSGRPLQRL